MSQPSSTPQEGLASSAIYSGRVRHRRFTPVAHAFEYRLFMLCLDLDELAALDRIGWWFKRNTRFWLASFCEDDYLPEHSSQGASGAGSAALKKSSKAPLKARALATVEQTLGFRPTGRVKMLAQCRYLGYVKNPLCTFFCFDADRATPVAIIAEVHNTPWGERHAYVLDVRDQDATLQSVAFDKCFHVSPFNPIDMHYRWQSVAPERRVSVHLENWRDGEQVMDATINLSREPFTAPNLRRKVIAFPVVTVKIISAIYWQALKLWLKRAPFYPHSSS